MVTTRKQRAFLAQIEKLLTDLYVKTGGRGKTWQQAKRAVDRFVQSAQNRAAR
jgi:hypothetical protein